MKVLLIGGGAREHVLGWKLAQSPLVHEIVSLPGNPGLAELGETAAGIAPADIRSVAAFAQSRRVDLVVVGPEDPLAAGIVDALAQVGIRAFGPSAAAARLEASKSFAKDVMGRAGVPTGNAGTFTERAPAIAALEATSPPYVVKADGLAGGKGVLVSADQGEAVAWVDRCLDGAFGQAGEIVLLEEHLAGPEVSIFALCDGKDAVLLGAARDYKRLRAGDEGPNTGGMGSFAPVGDLPEGFAPYALDEIVRPVVLTMHGAGIPFTGFLYAGLVLTPDGPKVLEFNVRMGDPEAQVVLPLLIDDLVDLILAAMDGSLGAGRLDAAPGAAVNVVLAAAGYPDSPQTGTPIVGVDDAAALDGVLVFHAGTAAGPSGLQTAGGRVLSVVGTGPTPDAARDLAYEATSKIHFDGMQFRDDIASP